MKVLIVAIGKPGPLLQNAIAEYEQRAARYWSLEVHEVREERAARGLPPERIRELESERLLERVPVGVQVIALTRAGVTWSSDQLARALERLAVESSPGAAFLIGGALGLSDAVLTRANVRLQLSSFTLPHEMARLMMAEQLYRAGTIVRGEPYHKAVKRGSA